MPFILKSTAEARTHLSESSKKMRDRIMQLKGALPQGPLAEPIAKLATAVGEGIDDLHTQHHSTWEALTRVDECGKQALQGVTEVKQTIAVHTTEIKALEIGSIDSLTAVEFKSAFVGTKYFSLFFGAT